VYEHVHDPAGVTLGAVYEAMRVRFAVSMHDIRKYRMTGMRSWVNHFLKPGMTVREYITNLERIGSRYPLDTKEINVCFYSIVTASDAEFEVMKRNGRVEGTQGEPKVEDG
jgi:hypothetical protein